MVMTKSENLVNVTAFADAVGAKLGDAVKLIPLAHQEDLTGEQTGTISVPKYKYVGDAELMVEGEAIDPSLLSQTAEDLTVKQAGKAVEITDKAVKSAFGDPIGEAENQVVKAIANTIDKELHAALKTATLAYTAAEGKITTAEYFKALELFGEDQEGEHFLVIPASQSANIKTDKNYVDGYWEGAQVIISNRLAATEAYIVKQGGLGLYIAKDVNVEQDRDILAKSTVLAADEMFASHLRDSSKVIKFNITVA